MSIATGLNKLMTDLSNSYNKVGEKSGTIPQNKNYNNLANSILSIPSNATLNIFIQDTQPNGYDGIWIANSNYSQYPIIEVADENSLVASSINIINGSVFSTILYDDFTYMFTNIIVTDSNGNELDNINIYYGTGLAWEKVYKYIQLDYIQNTGTQFIDTGFKPNQNTSVELSVTIPSSSADVTRFFESRNGNNYQEFGIINFKDSNNILQFRYNSRISTTKLNADTKYKITTNKNKLYVDDVLKITANTSTFQVNYDLAIFGFANGSNPVADTSTYRLHYFKLYNNGTLIRDFIPVKDLNNIVCLYDKVSKTFFYNAGTGTFVAGGEV